jgi:type IV pilus assembly protein PilM
VAFDFSFRRSRLSSVIGLDIGVSSVKLVELSGANAQTAQLEHYAIEPLPVGAVVEGSIEKQEQVVEVIKRAWTRSGTRVKNAVLALPSAAVITRRINLPAGLREHELEVQVENEASQYIPFPLDEVSLDFQVLGPLAEAPDDVSVLVAAARRETVDDRVAVVEAAGLKTLIVDVESFAAQNALQRLIEQMPDGGQGRIVAVFFIGATSTNLAVMLDGQNVYERDQPFGGRQLTADIARTYGISPEEAEARKILGDLPAGCEQQVLAPFRESAATEIARALQFFFTSTVYTRVDHILLAGGSASLPGLAARVQERAQVPAEVISPFSAMSLSNHVREKQLRKDAPGLIATCGLALRRFTA